MIPVKAAVLEQLNAPLAVRDIQPPRDLEYGHVLVRVTCAGLCGAQLQEISGQKGDPSHLPHLLGHEGCGIVEKVAPRVHNMREGDKVVLHWRKGTGCDVNRGGFYNHGIIKSGPVTCFSQYTVVSENRVTKVPGDFPDDLACLLGCSLSTALGVIENEAKVKFGESVLVIGCGGVGLALILAAKLAHAHPVVGIDISDKSDLVESLGAMFRNENPFNGFDVIIDTTGKIPEFDALGPSGRYIVVGHPSGTINHQLSTNFFSGNGQRIQATQGGCFHPSTDIPRYIQLWRSGALDHYKKLITHRIPLDQINEGFELMRQGKAGRVLVEMNQPIV